jgi:RHS repeat-associated protein
MNSLSSNNTVGKLTKVSDSTGYTEYAYDNRGNNISERKVIDDLTVQFHRSYDELGRMKKLTYPEGTEIEYMYTNTGQITSILMHAHDGSYRNQPVVQYIGPIQEDGKLYVKRKTGNNVVMNIEYDPLRRRPKSLKTVLAEGQTEQNISYTYDKKGNINSITDRLNESRSQNFTYDALNRVTKAIGKYGTEDYSYHSNGNMLQRGQFTLQYSNSNHVHAVTKVSSLQTGDTNYTYDTTGNLIERDGDVYRYNAMGKLAEITTAGGDVFQYSYDASGNRIKKQLKNANTTTYNFNNLYEIHRSPGEPEKHTMYIPGIEGDKVAQYTRSDALLVQANINENKYASIFTDNPDSNSIFDQRRNYLEAKHRLVSLFQEIETDIALVWFNIPKPKLFTDNYNMLPSMRVLIWLLAFGILIYYSLTLNTQDSSSTRRIRLATSFALFPFFFATSAGCSPLFFGGAQGEEGIPPWFLLATVPGDTPSVSDEPNFFGGGSGAGASTTNSARITGMYFYHPDHLGSITMITDGRGNVLAGGERGGKSHITYKPYGEILRTDSYGPDISKYKYTGQEEDRESGLMYYKARYYDAKIGRFLQSDSETVSLSESGMNTYMYVAGNPLSYTDSSGNNLDVPFFTLLYQYSKIPDGEGKQASTLALMYYQHQQVKRAGARACPASGQNYGVFGNFQGNGACGTKTTRNIFKNSLELYVLVNSYLGNNEAITLTLAYLVINKPKSAVTIVDASGDDHDTDHNWDFTKTAMRSNEEWIKKSWGNYFSINAQKDQYWREYNSLPKSYNRLGNTGKSIVAGYNYIHTASFDFLALRVGTGLFAVQNILGNAFRGLKSLNMKSLKQVKFQ